MVSWWLIIGLIVAAVSVSTLGAAFSVLGLGALFSGAAVAVYLMSSALEFAKFVLSAYLHQRWPKLNFAYKSYLTFAIVVLSAITSLGIFGFLSSAYQSASADLDAETIKLESLKTQKMMNVSEIARLTRAIDEVPANRVTKKMQIRAEIEPSLNALNKQSASIEQQITDTNLKILKVKDKVGPLIYIARAMNVDIDTVVKYLIFVFVLVFDPLAICLVIATNEALNSRREKPVAVPEAVVQEDPGPEVIRMRFAEDSPLDQKSG